MLNITRRQFLSYVGAAGGASALLKTSLALGLMPDDESYNGPVKIKPA
ncbi:MAG: monoamine oxidase, partial [Paraglaciecola sp.]